MAKPALSLTTLPELAGWLTFGEAAQELGVTTERIRQLATTDSPGRLRTARRIGRRPVGIVREAEIRALVARRAGRSAPQEPEGAPPDAGELRPALGSSGRYTARRHSHDDE